jgi:hypothetical protein
MSLCDICLSSIDGQVSQSISAKYKLNDAPVNQSGCSNVSRFVFYCWAFNHCWQTALARGKATDVYIVLCVIAELNPNFFSIHLWVSYIEKYISRESRVSLNSVRNIYARLHSGQYRSIELSAECPISRSTPSGHVQQPVHRQNGNTPLDLHVYTDSPRTMHEERRSYCMWKIRWWRCTSSRQLWTLCLKLHK